MLLLELPLLALLRSLNPQIRQFFLLVTPLLPWHRRTLFLKKDLLLLFITVMNPWRHSNPYWMWTLKNILSLVSISIRKKIRLILKMCTRLLSHARLAKRSLRMRISFGRVATPLESRFSLVRMLQLSSLITISFWFPIWFMYIHSMHEGDSIVSCVDKGRQNTW